MEIRSGIVQEQSTQLNLRQEVIQAITILQFSSLELVSYLEEITQENPLIDLEIHRQEIQELDINARRNRKKHHELLLDNLDTSESLADFLNLQLAVIPLTNSERKLLDYYILNLDDNGFIDINEMEVMNLFNVKNEEMERVLQILQQLEPAGIGARNLQECLLLQLERIPDIEEIYLVIIERYFQDFVSKKWAQLAKRLKVPLRMIQQFSDFVKTLNPRPASRWEKENTDYIIPDINVEMYDGKWMISLKEDELIQLKLNPYYTNILKERKDSDAYQYLVNKKQQFDWLETTLMQRRISLLSLIKEILSIQGDFFQKQINFLQPMTMKEVAARIGVHESTVSRLIKNKYLSTPRGTYLFKDLFTRKVFNQPDGEIVSNEVVKTEIEKIVLLEDKYKPFSDQKIAELLTKKGFQVARRTVSKYRDQLNIPTATIRKRFE